MDKQKNEFTVLGTFSGECADSNVTNENGLDIPREVWENVFNSDIYKQGIDLGWHIGFLGHPDYPNCMDFQQACIVMTEGHIEDDGKVYGEFNLIDTPVGRIVKTFIDSGVTFGISVRGAGDIIDNSVDPDTFVFRGFDLVTFPAYKEAIPEFKAIAASTDVEDRKKYKRVCAAVEKDLENITSKQAIEVIQEQLPEQSETYKHLEDRKQEIMGEEVSEEIEESTDIMSAKLEGMTELYLQEKQKAEKAQSEFEAATKALNKSKIEMNRKLHSMERIVAAQERDVEIMYRDIEAENSTLKNKNRIVISANQHLKDQLDTEKENNLQYLLKIEASEAIEADKDSTIRDLKRKLDETVIEASNSNKRASNLDGKVRELNQQIIASQKLIEEYQDAYASLYAHAVGGNLNNVSVTASTTVPDLQKKITCSSAQEVVSDSFAEPQLDDFEYDFDDDDLVTL